MKKKLLLPLTALSLMALAGCGNKGGGGQEGGIKVIFWHTFGDKIEAALKTKAAQFSSLVLQNEGVAVTVEFNHLGGYNDVKRIVGSALEAGNGPTMTISYPDSVAALMKKETFDGQYIVNMEDFFDDEDYGFGTDEYLGDDKEGTEDFIQSYLEEGAAFSKPGTYVMPYMKSSEIMLYNKTAAVAAMKIYKPSLSQTEAINFIETMSFDELMELAKVCVDNKTQLGFGSMDYPVFYDSDSNMLITQIEQVGLKYSYLSESNKVVLGLDATADPTNAAEVKGILEQYQSWHLNKYITTKATEGTYASDSFKNQKCFFTIGSSGGAGYSFPEAGTFDCGFCRVPYLGDHKDTNYNNAKFISQGPSIAFCNDKSLSSSENKQRLVYGWKFYKFITSTDVNVELCVNGSEGYVPVRNSCYASEDWAEFISDDTNNYALCARILRDKIKGKFLTSLVFNGSDVYRNEMTGLVGETMKAKTPISDLMNTAINNTKNAMD